MSHTIENGKRVIAVKTTGDDRWPAYIDEVNLYAMSGACNNVSPRNFQWEVVAIDSSPSVWNGEVMVPQKIWSLGYAADGGSIKPYGKDVSGIGYVRAWKKATKERVPALYEDALLWKPQIVLWLGPKSAQNIATNGAAAFYPKDEEPNEKYWQEQAEKYHAAFTRLFKDFRPAQTDYGQRTSTVAYTREALLDAVYLYSHADRLPFSIHLIETDDSLSYLRRAKPMPQPAAV